jgi:hypothetical protein
VRHSNKPPSLSTPGQIEVAPGFMVALLCGGNSLSLKLELVRSDEVFFETLQKIMKEIRPELNHNVDYVQFTPQKEYSREKSQILSLEEDQLMHSWSTMAEWLNGLNQSSNIYAFIKQDAE